MATDECKETSRADVLAEMSEAERGLKELTHVRDRLRRFLAKRHFDDTETREELSPIISRQIEIRYLVPRRNDAAMEQGVLLPAWTVNMIALEIMALALPKIEGRCRELETKLKTHNAVLTKMLEGSS